MAGITFDHKKRNIENLAAARFYSGIKVCVAVGAWASADNTLGYSLDGGITWVGLGKTILTGDDGTSAYWDGNKFIIGGCGTLTANAFSYSYDGINWIGDSTETIGFVYGICSHDKKYVAVGTSGNNFATSTDGITWTGRGSLVLDATARGVCWGCYKFVAVGNGTSHTLAYSYDGMAWTGLGKTIFSTNGYGVCWNGSMFVAVGNGTNTIAYSSNGINWYGSSNGNSIFTYGKTVCWNGDKFIAGGAGSNTIAYSFDGSTWIGLGPSIFTGGNCNGITSSSTQYSFSTKQWKDASNNVLVEAPFKYVSSPYLNVDSISTDSEVIVTINSIFDLTQKQVTGFCPPALSSAPSSPSTGELYFNTTDSKLYIYTGSVWKSVTLSV